MENLTKSLGEFVLSEKWSHCSNIARIQGLNCEKRTGGLAASPEARKAKNRNGSWAGDSQAPPCQLEGLGERCKLPSGYTFRTDQATDRPTHTHKLTDGLGNMSVT